MAASLRPPEGGLEPLDLSKAGEARPLTLLSMILQGKAAPALIRMNFLATPENN